MKKAFAKRWISVCLVVLVLSVAAIYDYFTYNISPMPAVSFDKGQNGLWLRYYWYKGKHTDKELTELAKRLSTNHIKYAYFHVLNIDKDGSLHLHEPKMAEKIVQTLHRLCPEVKCLAWVYVGSVPYTGPVDLTKTKVRQKMVDESLWLLNECGFDGVQWDYEFCPNDDRGFLTLLEETRTALPADKILSCDTPMWYPGILWGWHDDYFKEVAKRTDQLVVMCYDSLLRLPRAYAWLVAQQVIHVSKDASVNPKCEVLFGLPTYEDATKAHDSHSENLVNAIHGFYDGVQESGVNTDQVAGIALFADYTTDKQEWDDYQRYWLHR